MAGHGGKRKGAGRKPRATEQALLESLDPLHPLFIKGLESGLKDKQGWAIKMYAEYYYGKPKQTMDMDITSNGQDINFTPIAFVGSDRDK